MKKILLAGFFWLFQMLTVEAQHYINPDSSMLIKLNQQIDSYVVERNLRELENRYADDFVFSHGSGRVEGKAGWLKSVAKGSFVMRRHDSVTVEMHPGIAILKGKLSVHKKSGTEISRYHLKYIRVYALRDKQWQMISHLTYWEYHEPGD